MSLSNMALARPFNPTTFQERGVTVPFTTPLLGGARARPGRNSVELVVHNPAGGRGTYVMPWTGVTSLCRPTLHDKVLNTRISVLPRLTPAAIRAASRAAAAEGLAGERAMVSAGASAAADKVDQLAANRALRLALIRQVNVVSHLFAGDTGPASPELDATVQKTAAVLGPHFKQGPLWAIGAIAAIAEVMACLGLGADGEAGRIPRLMHLLQTVRNDVVAWSSTRSAAGRASYAHLVDVSANVTLALAEAMATNARALTNDMLGLLRAWSTGPDSVIRLVERADWLLDGWEQICLIWKCAEDDAARRAALVEIADLVPVLPREAGEWSGYKSDLDKLLLVQQPIGLNEDWRTGATVYDLIARNEQFRAFAT